jgi:hypothetical protein
LKEHIFLHLHGEDYAELNLLPFSTGILLGLLFNPEDQSDVSHQNMGLSPN